MFLPVVCCRHCYVGIHFAKIVHLFQISKEMDKNFLSEPRILTFATIFFHFIAFINSEWLTPDEREPPACSPSAVESIGGILREEGFIVSIFFVSS